MAEYISREEAINAIKSLESSMPAKDNYAKGYDAALGRVLIAVRGVPPATDVQPINQWISVKDRLPEIKKSVLVIVSINAKVNLPLCTDLALEMRIGWLDDNGKWGLQFDSADSDEILYWMPLPEPPKDGDTNG